MRKQYDIFGIGNALVDVHCQADEAQILRVGLKKGVMNLVDEKSALKLRSSVKAAKVVPAGGTTNTLLGISALGGRCVMVGQVGPGEFGCMYEKVLAGEKIALRLVRVRRKTGVVYNFITPDAERTFAVSLGAAVRLRRSAIIEDDIRKSRLIYFTGYELESSGPAVRYAVRAARKSHVTVSMDLADPLLVKRKFSLLKAMVKNTDILFLNESEAMSFTGLNPEESARLLGRYIRTVAVKIGAKGSIVSHRGRLLHVPAVRSRTVDTTGAGDMYAAGFLYCVINRFSVAQAAQMGSYMGHLIVGQVGAFATEQLKRSFRRHLLSLKKN